MELCYSLNTSNPSPFRIGLCLQLLGGRIGLRLRVGCLQRLLCGLILALLEMTQPAPRRKMKCVKQVLAYLPVSVGQVMEGEMMEKHAKVSTHTYWFE